MDGRSGFSGPQSDQRIHTKGTAVAPRAITDAQMYRRRPTSTAVGTESTLSTPAVSDSSAASISSSLGTVWTEVNGPSPTAEECRQSSPPHMFGADRCPLEGSLHYDLTVARISPRLLIAASCRPSGQCRPDTPL